MLVLYDKIVLLWCSISSLKGCGMVFWQLISLGKTIFSKEYSCIDVVDLMDIDKIAYGMF